MTAPRGPGPGPGARLPCPADPAWDTAGAARVGLPCPADPAWDSAGPAQTGLCGPVAARRLASHGRGLVHSTFSRSANLLYNDRLVALVDAGSGLNPFALRLPGGLPRLAPGQGFTVDSRGLSFQGGPTIALAGMALGRLRRPRLALDPAQPAKLRRLAGPLLGPSALAPLLDAARSGEPLLGGDAGPRFLDAFAACDQDRACALGLSLVGLGPGLTPAYDDFFVGLAASLAFFPPRQAARRNRIIARLARAARRLTTRVSREYLCCAARGWFSEPVLAVLHALPGPDPAPALAAMERLARCGHSSGADSLVGLLAGIAPLGREPSNPKP